MDRPELFARRNRLRIVGLLIMATVVYWMAVCAAAVATAVLGVLWLFSEAGLPDSIELLKWTGISVLVVLALSIVIGSFLSLFRLPTLRRKLEAQVLRETGAHIADPDEFPEVRNLLEGLALVADIPVPRFVVIADPVPNSFGVGTRPKTTILGITSGLPDVLTRDELEAALSYEVSRIGSWDIALSSWTVALTSGAIVAAEADDLKAVVGWIPARTAEWLQAWALRDQGENRDRIAIQFTRHPEALITALEKMDAEQGEVRRVSRATAPLWLEVPNSVYGGAMSKRSKRMGTSILLQHRIARLAHLAGLPPRPKVLPEAVAAPIAAPVAAGPAASVIPPPPGARPDVPPPPGAPLAPVAPVIAPSSVPGPGDLAGSGGFRVG